MTTKINGTNTAASPAITGADTDTGLSFGTDTVNINTGGQTRATVDSNGRLGIGTTSPSSKLDLHIGTDNTGLQITSTDAGAFASYFDNTGASTIGHSGTDLVLSCDPAGSVGSSNIVFQVDSNNERMRIDSSGNVGIGTSSPSTGGNGISFLPFLANDTSRIIFNRNSSGYLATVIEFLNGGITVGSIKHNNSSTQYNTSSDYRLKENVVSISDGITRLKTLKPSRFNFKNDTDTTVDGFLAHEVTAVPEAIHGTKDEVDSDNNPIYQGIDQSKLVPLLTAALQEAVAKIEVLETKVAALEAG